MMAGSAKNNLKDKLEDGELDLSMMQYNDVPVKVCLDCLEKLYAICHPHLIILGDRAAGREGGQSQPLSQPSHHPSG